MKKITSVIELRETILLLEIKLENERQLLKSQFEITYENLRPVNLIKSAFSELVTTPDLKGNILNAVISLAVGYLSKKVMVGSTHNPIKQLLGTLLQVGVTEFASKNTDGIKSIGQYLIKSIFNKKEARD